jgi:uracil-DNA glycosylase
MDATPASTEMDAFFGVLATPLADPAVFNPWAEDDPLDWPGQGAAARLSRLRRHLAMPATRLLLVGEAPGYQGAHFSGVAFTSERLIGDDAIPRIAPARLTTRRRPWSEPSATIVWRALYAQGIAAETVLWNAFPWHPFKPGKRLSNRTPTRAELQRGGHALQLLTHHFESARVVAVGRHAERALADAGIEPHATLRHPARGGAPEFNAGLAKLCQALPPAAVAPEWVKPATGLS